MTRHTSILLTTLLLMTSSGTPVKAQDALSPAGDPGVINTGAVTPTAAGLSDLKDAAAGAGWSENDVTTLSRLIEDLDKDQLPATSVLDRARQGLVKKAPPARVLSVCDRLGQFLRSGGRLVDGRFGPKIPHPPGSEGKDRVHLNPERRELIDRTAFALEKGVPEAAVSEVFVQVKEAGPLDAQMNALDAPVLTLASLTSEGSPPAEAVKFVTDATGHGVKGKDLENLGQAIAGAIHGVDPHERSRIIQEILGHIERGIPPGQIMRDIPPGRGPGSEGPPGQGIGPDRPPRGRGPGDRPGGPPIDPGSHGRGRGGQPPGPPPGKRP